MRTAMLVFIIVAAMVNSKAFGQGAIHFSNAPPVPDAPIFNLDGITPLAGSRYRAQLWAGSSADSLAPVVSVPFLSGEGAGYFIGGKVIIEAVPDGAIAAVRVRAWDTFSGATYEEATIRGETQVFFVETGRGTPTGLTSRLAGMESFSLIPEPRSILLFSTGAALLLFRKRLRNGIATRNGGLPTTGRRGS